MLAKNNLLLASLPKHVLARWQPYFSLIELSKGQVLDLDDTDSVLYFPITCVLVIHVCVVDGPWVFFRFMGNRNLVGSTRMTKVGTISIQGRVCGAGYALTLQKAFAREQFPRSIFGDEPHLLEMARIAEYGLRSAYCGSSHPTSQRLAGLLLQAADCFGQNNSITLSQQEICELLLVRRETVAALLSAWAAEGLVETQRGRIRISDVDALRRRSCLCYPSWQRFYQEIEQVWMQTFRNSGPSLEIAHSGIGLYAGQSRNVSV